MNSETMTAYGDESFRHGRSRPCLRNQAWRARRIAAGSSILVFGFRRKAGAHLRPTRDGFNSKDPSYLSAHFRAGHETSRHPGGPRMEVHRAAVHDLFRPEGEAHSGRL